VYQEFLDTPYRSSDSVPDQEASGSASDLFQNNKNEEDWDDEEGEKYRRLSLQMAFPPKAGLRQSA
jgi:hypothetical protein